MSEGSGSLGPEGADHGIGPEGSGRGRLPEVLVDERLRPLWGAVHRRLEASGGRTAGVTAHLRHLSADQRAAVDRLLGTRSRGVGLSITLDQLDDLLRRRVDRSLLDVVTEVVGPVRDRPGERAALAGSEAVMWERLLAHRALDRHPTLAGWLGRLRATGAWHRLDEPESRLTEALDVLERLPQPARRGRSRLAARTLGDAHALDDLAPVGRLVTAALASLAGRRGALHAADRRRLWADQGVVSDETSSTVLTLGLRPRVVGPLTEAAGRWADGKTPLPIPLVAVQTERWQVEAGTRIWVCENPSVLAAATGAGATVVCLEGRPSLAALLLLRGLIEGGAGAVYHGDFGHGGIGIANEIIGALGAGAWRFGVDDHRVALDHAESAGTALRPLRGGVPDACWDPLLAPAIRASGVEVEEELVIDLLLDDLGGG